MKSVWRVYNGGMAKKGDVKTEETAEALPERYPKTNDPSTRLH
jgi:hypothetical protein